jgi:hypothetical protein
VNLLVAFIEDRRLGLAGLGALAIAVGSVLPWIRVPQPLVGITTGYGLQDDGKVTIVLGLLALALIVAHARLRQRDLAIGASLLGLAAAGLAAAYIADLDRNAARVIARLLAGNDAPIDPGAIASFPARIGVGIYVIFGGAAVLALAGAALTVRARGKTEPAPQASA